MPGPDRIQVPHQGAGDAAELPGGRRRAAAVLRQPGGGPELPDPGEQQVAEGDRGHRRPSASSWHACPAPAAAAVSASRSPGSSACAAAEATGGPPPRRARPAARPPPRPRSQSRPGPGSRRPGRHRGGQAGRVLRLGGRRRGEQQRRVQAGAGVSALPRRRPHQVQRLPRGVQQVRQGRRGGQPGRGRVGLLQPAHLPGPRSAPGGTRPGRSPAARGRARRPAPAAATAALGAGGATPGRSRLGAGDR